MSRANTDQSMINIKRGDFLGVLYLDSRRPAAFSKLDRQFLTLSPPDAASILDNARLVERERERQRLEQEIGIGAIFSKRSCPRIFATIRISPSAESISRAWLSAVTTSTFFPARRKSHRVSLADVSGKGLGAALCTNLLQGALSAMSLGTDPARVF